MSISCLSIRSYKLAIKFSDPDATELIRNDEALKFESRW